MAVPTSRPPSIMKLSFSGSSWNAQVKLNSPLQNRYLLDIWMDLLVNDDDHFLMASEDSVKPELQVLRFEFWSSVSNGFYDDFGFSENQSSQQKANNALISKLVERLDLRRLVIGNSNCLKGRSRTMVIRRCLQSPMNRLKRSILRRTPTVSIQGQTIIMGSHYNGISLNFDLCMNFRKISFINLKGKLSCNRGMNTIHWIVFNK